MVIVRLSGGLGNQMFQYACGRAVAARHGVDLKLDAAGFPDHLGRQYELAGFPIRAVLASQEECAALRWRPPTWLERAAARLAGGRAGRHPAHTFLGYKDCVCSFTPAVFDCGPDAYLEGYWQSPRFFADIADDVRAELQPRGPTAAGALQAGDRIRAAACPVSVHFRRTDYLNEVTARFNGVCPLEYYDRALETIAVRVGGLSLLVFSDDPVWVADHFRTHLPITVIPAGHTAVDDLWLMSRCRHHIIANSSFSWWAAWLNPRPGKVVIAPRQWFADPGQDAADLFPEEWVRV